MPFRGNSSKGFDGTDAFLGAEEAVVGEGAGFCTDWRTGYLCGWKASTSCLIILPPGPEPCPFN